MFEYFDESFKENHSHEIEFIFNQYKFNKTTDWDFSSRLFCVMYGLLFIIGIPANTIVIFVYAKSKSPKKYTKFFFINLSISDILILLLCIPISINDVLYPNEWLLGEIYCKHICFFISKYI